MAKANGGESGRMTWERAWNYMRSLPYDLQKEVAYTLNKEIYDFLPFATEETQREVLDNAPDWIIKLFRDKKKKYTRVIDGEERIGYLPVIKPDVLEYLNESRHIIKTEPKRKKRGCHSKHA